MMLVGWPVSNKTGMSKMFDGNINVVSLQDISSHVPSIMKAKVILGYLNA